MARNKNTVTNVSQKAVEPEVKRDDEDKDEEEQERERAEKDKKKDLCPIFGCIIIADGAPLVSYPLDTVNALGNSPMSRYSTAVRVYNRMFEYPELVITINIGYGTHNVQLASISLPLNTVTTKPKAGNLAAEQLRTFLGYQGLTAEPQIGAFMQEVIFDNQETDIRFNRRALSDLQALHMPGLGALQSKITSIFTSQCLSLTMLVTEEWKDFATWSEEFQRLFNESTSDPKAALKTRAKGQPITVRNYVPQLPEDARRLPARMKFRDVDDCITSLGDGTAREHAYEKWASTEIGIIQCYALMMPIGTQKCVLKRGDKDVQVPYLYSFSVVRTSDDKLFAQLVPAINTSTKIQVQIGYAKVKTPTHDKSPEEVVGMIGNAMHTQLWSYRHTAKVSKEKLDQAWVDAYTNIIKPYIITKEFKGDGKVIHGFASMIAKRLQKIRADKDRNIKSETPKEHRQRTTEQVNKYRNHLQLPPDTTADIPQFSAVRMVHDEPLDKVSDFQFVAFRPKQMKWPKSNLGLAPAPFLDFEEPRLPKHGNLDQLADFFITAGDKRKAKYLVPIRFVEVEDDMTAKSKVQGLLKMKEFQHTPLVEWFTTFNGNPITTDVTQVFSVLRQVMHDYYYDPALPSHQSDDVQPEQLSYPQPLRDGKNHVIAITTPEFQRQEAIVAQRVRAAMDMFSEDQLQAMKMLRTVAFGTLIIEGVPGSGKTTLAHIILLACMYSSVRSKPQTVRQPSASKMEDSDDFDSDSAEDDKRYDIKPVIAASSQETLKEEAKPALPEDLCGNPQVMIIANQNVNGDDSARLMDKLLNEDLQFDELIVRVTNLQLENKALKKSFRPERDEGIRHAPSISDLVHLGIQGDKLHAFATHTGDFSTSKHGGVWKLENIMRQKLNDGENPSLLRQLTRLSKPADVFTDEERLALNKSIDDFMRSILKQAKVVICTFVVAQSLVHKDLFKPTVVLVDEASRESELHIRWAQIALTTHLIMLTGDFRQDEPFVGGRYASEKEHKNIHMNQILTPMSRRVMTQRPDCVVFLSENRRQHGDMHKIPSDNFYGGEMRTVYDTRYPTRLASVWHTFAQKFVRDMRALKPDKDLNDGLVAEYFHGNRVSLLCSSTMTQRGRSPVNFVHARLAVEIAARIHQSHIPGSDESTRPRICIITPYSAQVDETKNQLRKLSSKEICHDLIEVRTQTSSTGGEWDVVILCFVRDSSMGFLSETNRLNVMWTRARYLSIDIFDEEFYRRPHGRGSKVIDRYRETQALKGGQCKDLRNWYQVCHRCCTPHEKDCRGTLKCFFCENTGHHVRNCTAPGSLGPTINPDVMEFPRIS